MAEVSGFSRPTFAEIQTRIMSDINVRLPSAESRLRRSVLNVLAAVMAGAIHLLYGFISFVAQNTVIDTSQTEWLERHAGIWGIARKAPAFATGGVEFTGVNGTGIPQGASVQRIDGARFTTSTEGGQSLIAAGIATVQVTADLPGIDGNTLAGVPMSLLVPVAGIDTEGAVDASGISGGEAVESDDDLRSRLLLRIQNPPHGGIESDYVQWALEVAGVTRAWAFPAELGLGTVSVRFVKDDKVGTIIPDAGEVAAVQAHIDTKRPVTATTTVVAPTTKALDLTMNIVPDTAAIRAAVTDELTDLLLRDGKPGDTLFLSRIQEAISIASGETHHTLTVPSADVTHIGGEMPIMGTITWT